MAAANPDDDDIIELCEQECVSDVIDVKTNEQYDCNNPKTKKYEFIANCYTFDDDYRTFYKKITTDRWKLYIPLILKSFPNQCHLNNSHETNIFRRFLSKINGHAKFISSHFSNNSNFNFCGDLVCNYRIQIHNNTRNFFHITFHSEKPRYIRNHTRSHYTCGAWKKNVGDTKGSFHYRVDAANNKFEEGFENHQKPYKRFHPDDDLKNGRIKEDNGQRFSLGNWSQDGKAERDSLCILHEYIYLQFIKHWNRCMDSMFNNKPINDADAPWAISANTKIEIDEKEQETQFEDLATAISYVVPGVVSSNNLQQMFSSNSYVHQAYTELLAYKAKVESQKLIASQKAQIASQQPKVKLVMKGSVSVVKKSAAAVEAKRVANEQAAVEAKRVADEQAAAAAAAAAASAASKSKKKSSKSQLSPAMEAFAKEFEKMHVHKKKGGHTKKRGRRPTRRYKPMTHVRKLRRRTHKK